MRRIVAIVVFAALVLAATPSAADVTITVTVWVNVATTQKQMSFVIYIKGMKGRFDAKGFGDDSSIFQDIAAGQQVIVNHATKEVRGYAPALGPSMTSFDAIRTGFAKADAPATMGEARVSVRPSGQTKRLLGRTCIGYTTRASGPLTLEGEPCTVTMSRRVWLALSGGDVAEWLAFAKAAGAAGMDNSPFGQGPQSDDMAGIEQSFPANSVRFQEETQVKVEGSGPKVKSMARMGTTAMTVKVTAISSNPIPDDVFTVPAGYTKK